VLFHGRLCGIGLLYTIGSALFRAKEVTVLDGVCPRVVSTRCADDGHDKDETGVGHDCRFDQMSSKRP
jgi:hypothetical protein